MRQFLGSLLASFDGDRSLVQQIEAMRDVKRRLDPNWLLGQGNLFPAP